jgi:hypothetical protein
MSLEKAVADTTKIMKTTVRETEKLVKKAWSIMDAASEKAQPSEYLSPRAVQSIQGKHPQG